MTRFVQDGITIPPDLDRQEFFSTMEDFISATGSGIATLSVCYCFGHVTDAAVDALTSHLLGNSSLYRLKTYDYGGYSRWRLTTVTQLRAGF